MTSSIAIVLEIQDEKVSRQSWEALQAARELGKFLSVPVDAILLGHKLSPLQLDASVVGRVICVEAPELELYTPDGYANALADFLNDSDYSHVLFPHSYQVREFAPKLATRLGRPFLSDCIGFHLEGQEMVFSRQLYQGKFVADVGFDGPSPHLLSIQAGAFSPAESTPTRGVPTKTVEVSLGPTEIRTRPLKRFQESVRTVDLTKSDVIVAVGRGIKEPENIAVAEKLAQAMGAQLAGSRPICDNGWLPMERQVGSSGQTVAPKLYFAVGISGAIQHVVGMKSARKIVAINKDQNAPIFDVADIGIVANLFDILPAITEEILRDRQG